MESVSPKAFGYRMPAEWEPHSAVWLAWPSHKNLWLENLKPAQDEFLQFCHAIADVDSQSGKARGEKLNVLVPTLESGGQAEVALRGLPVQIHLMPFGDIWLRDTAPIFVKGKADLAAVQFQFNSWGNKYDLPEDLTLAKRIAEASGLRQFSIPFVLEGGSVEVDGEGTCLTSQQCLLNSNRNPHLKRLEVESHLKDALGAEKVLWLADGLLNDHTDGHIDTIARFVGSSTVLCMRAASSQDPNERILLKIESDLRKMTDAQGRALKVVSVPSPGAVLNEDGDLMPASYLNFYIANSTVIVPTYGSSYDDEAVAKISESFPDRKTVGISAKAILSGGGAFHCISQQVPV